MMMMMTMKKQMEDDRDEIDTKINIMMKLAMEMNTKRTMKIMMEMQINIWKCI